MAELIVIFHKGMYVVYVYNQLILPWVHILNFHVPTDIMLIVGIHGLEQCIAVEYDYHTVLFAALQIQVIYCKED
jgi:hypothetical protein